MAAHNLLSITAQMLLARATPRSSAPTKTWETSHKIQGTETIILSLEHRPSDANHIGSIENFAAAHNRATESFPQTFLVADFILHWTDTKWMHQDS